MKCVQLGCFHRGSTSLHSNFTAPATILRIRKLMTVDTGLADGEDRIPLRFLVLTQYRSVTDVQIFRSIHVHSACKASFVARCKN